MARTWLEEAFAQYEGPLLRYVGRFIRDDLAQEVVQEAFLKLCRQNRDEVEHSVGAWLYRVCRNGALDVLKKERRMQPIKVGAGETHSDSPPQSPRQEDPAQIALDRETVASAVAALQHLSDRDQEIVRLKIEHGLTYREIGEVLGLTASNVGYILHHSFRTLREHLRVD